MTHLKIEQNNGIIEEVSSAVIDKLYDIVHSGNLDNTSNLVGRLHTSATYQDYIDYLEDTFKVNGVKQLIIDATKKYMTFSDPVVASYWANSTYGDGVGIDTAVANTVLSIPNDAFLDNTSLQTFNELSSFTNCTSLGSKAFCGCTSLTSIDISNVTNISNQCFSASTALTTIGNFNTQITSIPFGCFDSCTSLVINDLNLPNLVTLNPYSFKNTKVKQVSDLGTITSVQVQAFYGCTQLTSAILPNTVTSIGDGAFYGCTSLPSVDLSNVTSIGSSAFRECSSLSNIDLSSVTEIQSDAFRNCTSLTSVTLDNCESIGSRAFNGCTSLHSINLPKCKTILDEQAFTFSGVTSIDLPLCTSIGRSTFHYATNLTTVSIPSCISIGPVAFDHCSSLTSIVLPEGLLTIGDYAFTVSAFTGNFEIPATVTSIGKELFRQCPGITAYIFKGTTPPTLSNGLGEMFMTHNNGTLVRRIYVPDSAVSAYQALFAENQNYVDAITPMSQLPTT